MKNATKAHGGDEFVEIISLRIVEPGTPYLHCLNGAEANIQCMVKEFARLSFRVTDLMPLIHEGESQHEVRVTELVTKCAHFRLAPTPIGGCRRVVQKDIGRQVTIRSDWYDSRLERQAVLGVPSRLILDQVV